MAGTELVVVENTPDTHNMIVCTLCSCYPRTILGLPPDWYKSKSYRSRAVIEPRAVLEEFGTSIPDDVTVRVHDSNADMRYLVLPMRPKRLGDADYEAAAEGFLKVMGVNNAEALDALRMTPSNLPDGTQVIFLRPSHHSS